MTLQIVTANRLIDGAVVYLAMDNTWSRWISDACTLDNDQAANQALTLARASAGRNEVVEPYLIDVRQEARSIKPLRYRETIRAGGPSTHPGHGIPLAAEAVAAGTAIAMAFLTGA